jgi:hypothetical protein
MFAEYNPQHFSAKRQALRYALHSSRCPHPVQVLCGAFHYNSLSAVEDSSTVFRTSPSIPVRSILAGSSPKYR